MTESLKATHPCAGWSTTAIKTFEAIAVGMRPPLLPKTIKALLEAGLIVRLGDRLVGRDNFGDITISEHEVPLPVHMQWCEWCAENVEHE